MAIQELTPRDLGGIVSETFRIYGRNFLWLVAIVAIVEVILGILGSVLVSVLVLPAILTEGKIEPLVPFMVWLFILIGIILIVVYIVAYALMEGALIHAVSKQSVGQPIGIGRAYRSAWKRAGALVGATVLVTLAVTGMAITIIGIPAAIYFGVTWSFIWQAALLEGYGPRAALSRSAALVKNNWWRVLGIVFVLSIIGAGISAVLGIIPVAGTIIGAILSTPVAIIGSTLLYYDLRLKKEGYKLEQMAQEVGGAETKF